MISRIGLAVVPVLLAFCAATSVNAGPIVVSFQSSGFGVGAPTDPVIGSIVYDAASTTSIINSLTAINLVIAGHTFTLGETGFTSVSGLQTIGGTLTGVGAVLGGTNDFILDWDQMSLAPSAFVYSATSSPSVNFTSFSFTQFSVTAVPEPSAFELVLLGVAAMALGIRKRIISTRLPAQ